MQFTLLYFGIGYCVSIVNIPAHAEANIDRIAEKPSYYRRERRRSRKDKLENARNEDTAHQREQRLEEVAVR
ncbi:uncharacterized protein LOC115482743 isoform X3 [Drosophila hydei]|uniref:Uncharacterized protein LOC111599773 isoform X4 n=1 Tax=Drosophila hydei TaxID=7224 RepID=A0A6J2SUR4_DROHY|nr:uncharacterized protein LOC111599773 isoform X4 [Drosophila hydei]XP_030081553.1 uncharacterized protein LOC115482743 isoform X3 [Drosophila hydei]